jgi:AcrR family transcriptional regulator
MPKVVDHEERRRAFAQAVWRVALKQGVGSISTRSVARESGRSIGTLAHYFSGKGDLMLQAFELVGERCKARLRHLPAPPGAGLEAVRAALAEALPLDEERRAESEIWFGFLGFAAADQPMRATARRRYEQWRGHIAELLRPAAEAGELGPERDLERLAAELVALTDGLAVQALFTPDLMSPPRQLAALDQAIDALRRT